VMVSGMALVSGGILGAYIGVGCEPRDLIVAILMTFPASIYLTKIVIPETDTPETLGSLRVADDRPDANLLAAAARGTREGLLLAVNVAAILVAFIALVALVNLLLGRVGGLWGRPELSLQVILGTALAPVAWLLGVPWRDCGVVGGLLGTRTVLNELIAYGELGGLRDALRPKSFMLATIALCGFANLSSIGIQLGGIGVLVPERRDDLARLGPKVLLIATLANFLSAALAGVLA
jgi:CNT family concentrative nucleoside transporter